MVLEARVVFRRQVGHKPPRTCRERFTSMGGGREVEVRSESPVVEPVSTGVLVSVDDEVIGGRQVGQSPPSKSSERLTSRRGGLEVIKRSETAVELVTGEVRIDGFVLVMVGCTWVLEIVLAVNEDVSTEPLMIELGFTDTPKGTLVERQLGP